MTERARTNAPPASAGSVSVERASPQSGPTTLPSTVVSVTLFEDRAEVERSVLLPPGITRARVTDLSPCLLPRSVEVTLVGDNAGGSDAASGDDAITHRVSFQLRGEGEDHDDARRAAIDEARALLREAKLRHEEATEREARAAEQRVRLDSLLVHLIEGLTTLPRGRSADRATSSPPSSAALEEAPSAALADVRASIARTIEDETAAYSARQQAAHEVIRAEARLVAASKTEPELVAHLHIHIGLDEARVAEGTTTTRPRELRVRYRVASALWRPAHLARLITDRTATPPRSVAELTTFATAWQTTGEQWENVRLRFSTARPTRPASPPPLVEDRLTVVRRADQRVVVTARDQTVAIAGLRDEGGNETSEMLGVDDGGEPLVFEAEGKVTLPSTGRPLRVEIERRTVPAKTTTVVYPERSAVGHIRALVTLQGTTPLLAGPLRIARNESIVGRTRLDFAAAGEPLELGFGADDSIRVKREVKEERDTTMLTGSQRIRRTVRVFVSNVSGESKSFDVVERIPVSEIADVEIITDPSATEWTLDAADGFATRRIELSAGSVASLLLSYEIRASSRVSLPF